MENTNINNMITGYPTLKNKEIVMQYKLDVKKNIATDYMLTVARDGEEPVRSIIFYSNVLEAVDAFNSYTDWGFAKTFLTVCLYEPTGKQHEKILERPQGIESKFFRFQYIEIAQILKELKPHINNIDAYKTAVQKIAKIFAIDNYRFDVQRFFDNTDYYE